jgi:4-amino-4-deoxy-L-arabinose transferase-like glycosyltransferase
MNASYVVYKHNYSMRLESTVTTFILVSMLFYIIFVQTNKIKYLYFFALASGLAFLTKGFVGIIHFGGVFIFMLIYQRELFTTKRFFHVLAAFLLFLASFSWWYIYVSIHTDFYHNFFQNQVLDRLMDGLLSKETGSATYLHRPIYQYAVYLFEYYFYFLPFLIYGSWKALKDSNPAFRKSIILLFIVMIFDLVLIHFVTTRDKRYLYRFFVYASFFSAYGITSLFRFSSIKLIAGISCTYAVAVMIFSGESDWNSYKFLESLGKLSKTSGMPVVAETDKYKDNENRSGVDYFLGSYQTYEPESGIFFKVDEKDVQDPRMKILKKTRMLKIGIISKPAEDTSH